MKRFYTPYLREYAGRKILLIVGPRQVGKTTLAKMFSSSYDYLNYDSGEDRQMYMEKSWDRKKEFIIFDELHKMQNWKTWLKGVFDTEGTVPALVVTGSSKLDTYRKVGDSLAGRYFQYRLHPFDLFELKRLNRRLPVQESLERLLCYGGFPEPFLEGTDKFHKLWVKTHMDIILRQDLLLETHLREISSIELLVQLLRKKVASPLSYTSLTEDIQHNDKTIKNWLLALENMYLIFKILPFHKNIARSHLKRPKYYFYDISRVPLEGARLENLVACALLKWCHFMQDVFGKEWELYYLSTKGGSEVDFLLTLDGVGHSLIEVKSADDAPSSNFLLFERYFPAARKVQLVKTLKREKNYPNGIEIRNLATFLANLDTELSC